MLAECRIRVNRRGHCPLRENWEPAPSRPFWRLFWAEGGQLVFHHGQDAYPLDSEFLLAIPPWIQVSVTYRPGTHHRFAHVELGDPWDRAAENLVRINLSPAASDLLASHQQLPATWWLAQAARLPELVAPLAKMPDPWLHKVDAWLREHCNEDLDRERVASVWDMSASGFAKRYRRLAECTLQQAVRRFRVERAAHLLLEDDTSIEDIAAACGCCDRYHLTRLFTAAFGIGPAAYRRVH